MIHSKLKKIINKPQYLFLMLGHRGLLNWISDERYIKIAYQIKMDRKLNLNKPLTYNEKIQWLKINMRKSEYTQLADKYEVREYVKEKIGEEYLVPLIGVYNTPEMIDFASLPNKFVVKCTHDSGGLIICRDKQKLQFSKVRSKLKSTLSRNYYYGQREWVYKNIKPRIIVEEYLEDLKCNELRDYKFFCFEGKVKAMFVASNRGIDTRFDFFDKSFKKLDLVQKYPNADNKIDKPINFDKMVELAEMLSANINHVRVDFYEVNGKIYFGELTFFHFSGWEKFSPENYDEVFGRWLNLPELNKKNGGTS